MGLLRTLLAIAVVVFHTDRIFGLHMPDGVIAVQSFFVISGFYMAHVLSTVYESRPGAFYMNRFLRLFPIYWIVATATILALFLVESPFLTQWRTVFAQTPVVGTWVALTNIFLVGQDWNFFLPLADNTMSQLNLVNTAWTLGIELSFYALAPWLVRFKSWMLLLLLVASLLARVMIYNAGLYSDPWNYRLFPLELAFFLLGMILYRIFVTLELYLPRALMFSLGIAAAAVAIFVVFGQDIMMGRNPVVWRLGNIGRWYSIGILSVCIVFIFPLTKRWRWDRTLGEFSYPIYICHMFFISFFSKQLAASPLGYGLTTVVVAAAASWLLLLTTGKIDRVRALVRAGSRAREQSSIEHRTSIG